MLLILNEFMLDEDRSNLLSYLSSIHATAIDIEENILFVICNTDVINTDNIFFKKTVKIHITPSIDNKLYKREIKGTYTTVEIDSKTQLGGGYFPVIAGPCSIESENQMLEIAKSVISSGASILRGGAFKPRTSPHSFQGLELEGLKILLNVKKQLKIPIITEIMSEHHLEKFAEVDIIQVGARNMQNFHLLKELGRSRKTILLKRGFANTIEEFLNSAEYILKEGNFNLILCERGIRTFEPLTRNTLDISCIPIIKELSHLPIIVDPSHASGMRELITPLSKASIAAGSDGLMVEVHNNPSEAMCDGEQSLDLGEFHNFMDDIKKYVMLEKKTMY